MKKYAVIVAGGSGTRMNSAVPKQFLEINGKPILQYTIETFLSAYDDMQVILVLPEKFIPDFSFASDRIAIAVGGQTRFDSVKNGLAFIDRSDEAIVFVHDGVRCNVTRELIQRCYDACVQFGNAVPAVQVQDSIRMVNESGNHFVDRKNVYQVQTPQTFKASVLLTAFKQPFSDSFTDEATVVESSGVKIHLVEGDYRNIKVTRPEDLVTVTQFLSKP